MSASVRGDPSHSMQLTRVAPEPVPSLMHQRRVMVDRITYIGLDVHKESIVVAVARAVFGYPSGGGRLDEA
jgi:hypothetical protein